MKVSHGSTLLAVDYNTTAARVLYNGRVRPSLHKFGGRLKGGKFLSIS